ncbi:hypothetical protein EDC96DRAFT_505928 [Choanephora cucurbitarum]|nr:hypothetical protein EDC96DRAFT_505928 [Choanephora cucurbitarum]
MFRATFFSTLFALFALISFVNAIVINPKITTPSSGTKWTAGQNVTVKWKTTYGPDKTPIPEIMRGYIKLGYFEKGDKYNEHLKWDLASNFSLSSGAQRVTLPSDLETKHSYIIVLMGDSGNASKEFTIRAARK